MHKRFLTIQFMDGHVVEVEVYEYHVVAMSGKIGDDRPAGTGYLMAALGPDRNTCRWAHYPLEHVRRWDIHGVDYRPTDDSGINVQPSILIGAYKELPTSFAKTTLWQVLKEHGYTPEDVNA